MSKSERFIDNGIEALAMAGDSDDRGTIIHQGNGAIVSILLAIVHELRGLRADLGERDDTQRDTQQETAIQENRSSLEDWYSRNWRD